MFELYNWIKGWFCTLPTHNKHIKYDGMSVIRYRCDECGKQWYEKR